MPPKNVSLAECLNSRKENGNDEDGKSAIHARIQARSGEADITYIATDEGWLFLAVVIDLFSRQVVGWSLHHDMTRDIVIDALRMAWFKRHPSKQAGLMFHSDRGSQRQQRLPGCAQRLRHHQLNESAGKLLG